MANDCLVTRLKGSVEASLPFLGAIRLQTKTVETPSNTTQRFGLKVQSNVTVKALNNDACLSLTYNPEQYLTEVTITPIEGVDTLVSFYVSNGAHDLIIENKYDIITFGSYYGENWGEAFTIVDFADFECCSNMEVLAFNRMGCEDGNIEKLPSLSSLKWIFASATYNSVYGNIEHFVKEKYPLLSELALNATSNSNSIFGNIKKLSVPLTKLDVSKSIGVVGNVEEYVATQIATGRPTENTVSTVFPGYIEENIKYNNNGLWHADSRFTWDASGTITRS